MTFDLFIMSIFKVSSHPISLDNFSKQNIRQKHSFHSISMIISVTTVAVCRIVCKINAFSKSSLIGEFNVKSFCSFVNLLGWACFWSMKKKFLIIRITSYCFHQFIFCILKYSPQIIILNQNDWNYFYARNRLFHFLKYPIVILMTFIYFLNLYLFFRKKHDWIAPVIRKLSLLKKSQDLFNQNSDLFFLKILQIIFDIQGKWFIIIFDQH